MSKKELNSFFKILRITMDIDKPIMFKNELIRLYNMIIEKAKTCHDHHIHSAFLSRKKK